MNIRQLNSELQKAVTDLNEHLPESSEDLEYFRGWLQKQKHLTARLDDQFLISFLRGCKWSVQKAKEKIDSYYTIRTFLPEIFTNRDPFSPEIQRVLKAGIFYPLPNTVNPSGPRILILNMTDVDVEKTPIDVVTKVIFMTMDILLHEDDNYVIAGFKVIGNYKNTPLNYLLQITPALTNKYIACVTLAYPGRLKQYLGLNVQGVFETLFNTIVKPLLSEKLKNRVYLFNSNGFTKVKDVIDLSLLPKEFGGENGPMQNAAEIWKTKIESWRDWFLDDVKYGSNEKLRVRPSKTYNEYFGMEGTFRKLSVD
ncbi:hypothetical protein FQR65_LT11434 [Abscondita terminalis]|nr:hypothetical protein FQR65_LT11434 [Abscondita terminalis]